MMDDSIANVGEANGRNNAFAWPAGKNTARQGRNVIKLILQLFKEYLFCLCNYGTKFNLNN